MYLIKFVVGPADTVFSLSLVLHFLIYFVGAILFGSFMSWLVEIPTLKFRDKYFPRRVNKSPESCSPNLPDQPLQPIYSPSEP
jgi:hypothetical protein